MSKKSVSPQAIPIFEDTLSLSRDFNTAYIGVMLLVVRLVVLPADVFLTFVGAEV